MNFEWKNYPKYAVTLGEYYGTKVGLYHFADTLLFDTEYGKETFSQIGIYQFTIRQVLCIMVHMIVIWLC